MISNPEKKKLNIIKKSRVFTGCAEDKIIISKRDKSWKTIALTCKTNKSWNYTFRNKLAESIGPKISSQLSDLPIQRKKQETKLKQLQVSSKFYVLRINLLWLLEDQLILKFIKT